MTDENIVDLSDAPQHTGWGEETPAENTAGDLRESLMAGAVEGTPLVKPANTIRTSVTESQDRLERLFDGDATIDDLLAQMQAIYAFQAGMVGVLDAGYANKEGPDLGYIATSLTAAGIGFLYAYFQPLEDLNGLLTGNTDRIKVTAMMWKEVETSLTAIAERVGSEVLDTLEGAWSGFDADYAILRLGEAQAVTETAAMLAKMLSELMDLSSEFAQMINGFVRSGQVMIVGEAIAAVMALRNPVIELPGLIVSLVVKISTLVLDLLQILTQAMRVYTQGMLLMANLIGIFEEATTLLHEMATDTSTSDFEDDGGWDF